MITDGKNWHYLAVKCLSTLLRDVTSNYMGNFCCLNYFHSYHTKNKLEKHEKVCNDHDYCCVEMPEDENKILKYNHGKKSMKVSFINYADLECLFEKIHSCQNNPEKWSTTILNMHTTSGYSLFTNCSFDITKNKLDCYRGKYCMERFCKDLKKGATKIINYEEKEMIPLTDEENKSYEKQKVCYICKKEFRTDKNDLYI